LPFELFLWFAGRFEAGIQKDQLFLGNIEGGTFAIANRRVVAPVLRQGVALLRETRVELVVGAGAEADRPSRLEGSGVLLMELFQVASETDGLFEFGLDSMVHVWNETRFFTQQICDFSY
jgi:hypothetical protein